MPETAAQPGCALGLRTKDLKVLLKAKLKCPAEEVIMLSFYPPLTSHFSPSFPLKKGIGKSLWENSVC